MNLIAQGLTEDFFPFRVRTSFDHEMFGGQN